MIKGYCYLTDQTQIKITIDTPNLMASLLGSQDSFLKLIENGFEITISAFDNQLKLTGLQQSVDLASQVFEQLMLVLKQGIHLQAVDIISAIKMAKNGSISQFPNLYTEVLITDRQKQAIRVKTFGQRQYINAIKHHDLTFGIGPAGTGKTFLAIVMAVAALQKGAVKRLILTRPAVEAGESLGFLPGDLKEKVDPYLRPVYDALYQVLGKDHTERLLERGVIEIAPLAYMRGRTLDNAFIILDEAQNTTPAQMKMFLTRLGFGSKMIINGDVSQIDLPQKVTSGLIQAQKILQNVEAISFITLSADDVVRHPVVAKIINAYEQANKR